MPFAKVKTFYKDSKIIKTVKIAENECVSVRGELPDPRGYVEVTAYNTRINALNFGSFSGYLDKSVRHMTFKLSYNGREVEMILMENPDKPGRPLYVVKTLAAEARFYRSLITFNNPRRMAEFFFQGHDFDPYDNFVNNRGEKLRKFIKTYQVHEVETATMFQCIKITSMTVFKNKRQRISVFPCHTAGNGEGILIAAAIVNSKPVIDLWNYMKWKNDNGETLSQCVRMIPFRV